MPTPPPPAMKARICRRAAGARGPWNKWRGPVAGVAQRRTQWGGSRLCRESPLSPTTGCGTVCRWRVAGGEQPGPGDERGFGEARLVCLQRASVCRREGRTECPAAERPDTGGGTPLHGKTKPLGCRAWSESRNRGSHGSASPGYRARAGHRWGATSSVRRGAGRILAAERPGGHGDFRQAAYPRADHTLWRVPAGVTSNPRICRRPTADRIPRICRCGNPLRQQDCRA